MSPPTSGPWTYHDGEIFADVTDDPPTLIAQGVTPANAKLIAQAPRMAECLRSIAQGANNPMVDEAKAILKELD